MRVALDTNILAYAEGLNGAPMKTRAEDIFRRLLPENTFVPVQTLGELYQILVRKGARPPSRARDAVLIWRNTYAVIETSDAVLLAALDLATDHQMALWDAVILSAAAEAGCRYLFSEDMHDGFIWRGVTTVNPFSASRKELLESLFETE